MELDAKIGIIIALCVVSAVLYKLLHDNKESCKMEIMKLSKQLELEEIEDQKLIDEAKQAQQKLNQTQSELKETASNLDSAKNEITQTKLAITQGNATIEQIKSALKTCETNLTDATATLSNTNKNLEESNQRQLKLTDDLTNCNAKLKDVIQMTDIDSIHVGNYFGSEIYKVQDPKLMTQILKIKNSLTEDNIKEIKAGAKIVIVQKPKESFRFRRYGEAIATKDTQSMDPLLAIDNSLRVITNSLGTIVDIFAHTFMINNSSPKITDPVVKSFAQNGVPLLLTLQSMITKVPQDLFKKALTDIERLDKENNEYIKNNLGPKLTPNMIKIAENIRELSTFTDEQTQVIVGAIQVLALKTIEFNDKVTPNIEQIKDNINDPEVRKMLVLYLTPLAKTYGEIEPVLIEFVNRLSNAIQAFNSGPLGEILLNEYSVSNEIIIDLVNKSAECNLARGGLFRKIDGQSAKNYSDPFPSNKYPMISNNDVKNIVKLF